MRTRTFLTCLPLLASAAFFGCTADTDDPRQTPAAQTVAVPDAQVPRGARYPFPHPLASPRCPLPAASRTSDVQAAFAKWKNELVTDRGAGGFLRVRRPDSPNAIDTSNSEGMAYGMLIAVYMNEQTMFDAFFRYVLLHLNRNGLMEWEIKPDGAVSQTGAASDGDEDMAWALIMADRQWGGRGSLDAPYLEHARRLIDAMWKHEVDKERGYLFLPGDSWEANPPLNPSYFAPAYYRVFAEVSGEPGWLRVVDSSYDVIAKSLNTASGNATNGLVPAWCDAQGKPKVPFANGPTHYQLDSCRTPFRIAQDYCWFGEPRAKAYLDKINGFYAGIGAANITDGYDLSGTPRPQNARNGSQAASFVGPAAVGAMSDRKFTPLLEQGYERVATLKLNAGTTYYQSSWTVLSLLMLTGNLNNWPK